MIDMFGFGVIIISTGIGLLIITIEHTNMLSYPFPYIATFLIGLGTPLVVMQ